MATAREKRKGFRKSDKWEKTQILISDGYLKAHIPPTKLMNAVSLSTMLSQYKSVYIKPRHGSLGRGVIKLYKFNGDYFCHHGTKISRYTTISDLYRSIVRKTRNEPYIVQKGINLLRYQGKIFDFRVVVQRNPIGRYEVTGIAGRISQRHRVVSNGNGGSGVVAMDRLLSPAQYHVIRPKIETLALRVMKRVQKKYPSQKEIGIDVAIDNQMKIWIIEYNYRPDHKMFLYLRDRRMLNKIVLLGSLYGKRYKLY